MNLAWRDIRHKLGRFVLTCLGLSLLLACRDHHGRHLSRPDRRCPRARRTPSRRISGWSRPVRTAPSPSPRAFPAIRARWWRASTASPRPARSRCRTCRSSAAGRKLRLQVVGYEPGRPGGPVRLIAGREITRSHYELIADRQTGFTVGETVRLGRYDYTVVGRDVGRRHAVGRLDRLYVAPGCPAAAVRSGAAAARRETARGAAADARPISSMPWSRGSRPMCRAGRGGRGHPPLEAPFGADRRRSRRSC